MTDIKISITAVGHWALPESVPTPDGPWVGTPDEFAALLDAIDEAGEQEAKEDPEFAAYADTALDRAALLEKTPNGARCNGDEEVTTFAFRDDAGKLWLASAEYPRKTWAVWAADEEAEAYDLAMREVK